MVEDIYARDASKPVLHNHLLSFDIKQEVEVMFHIYMKLNLLNARTSKLSKWLKLIEIKIIIYHPAFYGLSGRTPIHYYVFAELAPIFNIHVDHTTVCL